MAFEGSSAQYYRDQASRIRALAETSTFPDTKDQMRTIASQYDRMAEQFEKGLLR
jgi:hypothetical protein